MTPAAKRAALTAELREARAKGYVLRLRLSFLEMPRRNNEVGNAVEPNI
jgi:hypothetical protein